MHSRIKKIVQALIRKYKTNNVYELARCLGIILQIVPLGSYAGSYLYIKRRKIICLNSCLNEYERIIVLAHER
ncbi:ImmA/IrrE family metallo-endopeptidase [Clostridium sp. WILCCON 0269]|uniref:ImmA/IrrE family metallo-endopeptidase n=1 Tax=Candidatus Clostridium eludens TaxID=3381663 RepID=A0ABW8SQA0_9CLOT